jgi:hypothetical protein
MGCASGKYVPDHSSTVDDHVHSSIGVEEPPEGAQEADGKQEEANSPPANELKRTSMISRQQSEKRMREQFEEKTPMLVLPWSAFKEQESLVRSDVALKEDMLIQYDGTSHTAIFISHNWWQTAGAATRMAMGTTTDTGQPDYTSGEDANLKYHVIKLGVASLIEKDGLDPSRVVLWMDWFSINQDDPDLKTLGIASLLRYTTNCTHMLVPLAQELADVNIKYPEQIPTYGKRAWCRSEFFCFSCLSEMRIEAGGIKLFACGRKGKLKQFHQVNLEGGAHKDMPSQGELTVEDDRAIITELEDKMIKEFGHQTVRNALLSSAWGASGDISLSGKLLRDEHMETLVHEAGERVTRLQLRNNQIGDAGLARLAKADLPNCAYVSLSSNQIGNEGAAAVMEALKAGRWPMCCELYLSGNAHISADMRATLKDQCAERSISAPYL